MSMSLLPNSIPRAGKTSTRVQSAKVTPPLLPDTVQLCHHVLGAVITSAGSEVKGQCKVTVSAHASYQ